MKTITIKQPWASLECLGIKDIENRTWATKFRGRVLIHAAKVENNRWFDLYKEKTCSKVHKGISEKYLSREKYYETFGKIIGSIEIVDCVQNHKSEWALPNNYHWVLANPILFSESIPVKGKLSFWDYPGILAEPEEKDGELFCHCQLPIKEENQVMGFIDHYRCQYCGGRWYK